MIRPFYFNKQTSNVIKAIAMFMMIWVHTFQRNNNFELYQSLFVVNGIPLAHYISRACNPVGLFMFISGYGLYYSYKTKGNQNLLGQNCKRFVRIFIPYLFITTIAMLFNNLLGDYNTNFSFVSVLQNITMWKCTYNEAAWYIMPFLIMSLFVTTIYKYFDKHEFVCILFSIMVYYIGAKLYGTYFPLIQKHQSFVILMHCTEFLLPMLIGASCAKHSKVEISTLSNSKMLSYICIISTVIMFIIGSCYGMILYPFYCSLLVLLIANTKLSDVGQNALSFVGKHSMSMWLIHAYFINGYLSSG